jgi:hypothetical protein
VVFTTQVSLGDGMSREVNKDQLPGPCHVKILNYSLVTRFPQLRPFLWSHRSSVTRSSLLYSGELKHKEFDWVKRGIEKMHDIMKILALHYNHS